MGREVVVRGRPKQLSGFLNMGRMGKFLSTWKCFLPIHKLAIHSYMHSLIIFGHDTALSFYHTKLFSYKYTF